VHSPASFWAALSESRELIGPLPRDRGWPLGDMLSLWRIDGWADVCDAGGFLEDPGALLVHDVGVIPHVTASGRPQVGLTDVRAGTDRIFLTQDEGHGEFAASGFTPVQTLPTADHRLSLLDQYVFAAERG
jgi:hypothetical protein